MEVIAAIAGAIIGIAGMSASRMIRRSGENRDVITKLSVGVEHIGQELTALRNDMKEDRHEIFGRLNNAEQRISALEAVKRNRQAHYFDRRFVMEIFAFLIAKAPEFLAALFAVHAAAVAIVNLTPTPKDDEFVSKAYRVIEILAGIVNKLAKD